MAKVKVINKLGLTALTLGLAACANVQYANMTAEEIVKERAQQRYDALMEKSEEGLKKAWEFTTPSYRSYTTHGQYNALVAGRGMWNAAKVTKVECEEDSVCEVTAQVTYTSPQMGIPITRPLENKWIKVDDSWWIYHK
ncbi:MAG: hypothetical protein OIF51_11495 [Cellvibrionaceae bacterium]|nr:hypothetical protein [Cellvibrionaceae bacterium]